MTAIHFSGGTIWRGAGNAPARSLLVSDGVIVALDEEADAAAEALRRAEGAVEPVDLADGFLMPSFGDGHAHPLFGGLEAEGPAVSTCTTVAGIQEAVARYAQEHPGDGWIFGASYDPAIVEEGLFDARWLDEAVRDRPVVLRAHDYHTVWVNSRALELAGIDAATPEPVLGEIPRRPDGTPLGTLREWGAVDLVLDAAGPRPREQRMRALERAGAYYLERGVTWVQDAWVEPGDVDTYLAAAERGLLPVRFNLALYADPRRFPAQLPAMRDARRRVEELGSPMLTAHTVKFFADGVIESGTGALLEPYCSGMHDHGMSVWPGSALEDAVRAVDAAGFQVHIHAIGDAAVRQALDAIERAIEVNGPRDRRPVIAHAQLVDDADLRRFAELGVIACMQPLWAQLDPLMTVLTVPRLGQERADRQYRLRSIDETGALLSFGSDWPVSSGAPLDGLAIAVSRRTADGVPDGGWTPHEIVPVPVALDAYSTAVAHQAFADDASHGRESWGRIEPGASADLVHLARDPRDLPAAELAAVGIIATYLAGEARYRATP
ncbi:amidohydrolase [Microbacterium hydrocarbonoxydans]|uniref:amidohydrolase n=1 Tax=Microbacterium hydrocarbonoxydans TaxID=273678 RepID=UPI0013DD75AE|nr:amidohydrolase [Microbacterium hydrocarbonoxydans]